MPRKNFPLWNRICSNQTAVSAVVHQWSSGEELESILMKLIKKISAEGSVSDSSSLNSSASLEKVQFCSQHALSHTLPLD
ncbi:hypothetical protein L6164_007865 [Bauhinia variegata]|nr:hypothetical protein L6164_007865 [Bauhinia variegata]